MARGTVVSCKCLAGFVNPGWVIIAAGSHIAMHPRWKISAIVILYDYWNSPVLFVQGPDAGFFVQLFYIKSTITDRKSVV